MNESVENASIRVYFLIHKLARKQTSEKAEKLAIDGVPMIKYFSYGF